MVKPWDGEKSSKGFFGDFDAMFNKLHGKELSYNNLLDVDAAVTLISEFKMTTLLSPY
jgi:AICAR transformylase/IMP cyclohydrolase PurH